MLSGVSIIKDLKNKQPEILTLIDQIIIRGGGGGGGGLLQCHHDKI